MTNCFFKLTPVAAPLFEGLQRSVNMYKESAIPTEIICKFSCCNAHSAVSKASQRVVSQLNLLERFDGCQKCVGLFRWRV